MYDVGFLLPLWEYLTDYGEVTTYYLGQTRPASRPGQPPPASPPSVARQRLIGPILESAPLGTRFLVIGTGPVLDLADFRDSLWSDRVWLAMMGQDHQLDWPHTSVYRTGNDPTTLANELLRL